MHILFLLFFLVSSSLYATKTQIASPHPGESLKGYRFIEPQILKAGEPVFVGDLILAFELDEDSLYSEDTKEFSFSNVSPENIYLPEGGDLEEVYRDELHFVMVNKIKYASDGSPIYIVFNGRDTYEVLRYFTYSVNIRQISRKKV